MDALSDDAWRYRDRDNCCSPVATPIKYVLIGQDKVAAGAGDRAGSAIWSASGWSAVSRG